LFKAIGVPLRPSRLCGVSFPFSRCCGDDSVSRGRRRRRDDCRSTLTLHAQRQTHFQWGTAVPGKARPFAMNFLQHSDFLLEVFDNGLLLSMDPTGQAQKNEFQRIHDGNMADSA
jgi:hypothetical protein